MMNIKGRIGATIFCLVLMVAGACMLFNLSTHIPNWATGLALIASGLLMLLGI